MPIKYFMNVADQLKERSNNQCELCASAIDLGIYKVPPDHSLVLEKAVYVCDNCLQQLEKRAELNPTHWLCLKESMWSDIPAIQVTAWRMLNRLKNETWATEALDMLYLDDDNLEWAKTTLDHMEAEGGAEMHRDCNGVILQSGDSITLTKSLDVKGSQVNARIGTAVKNIKLVHDNTEQIEGKIDGQTIVILTKYVRKSV